MTHNKYLTQLLEENNDPILGKSAAQILSLNLKQNFLRFNFLSYGLCNSSVSFLFTFAPDPIFMLKNSNFSNFISSIFQNIV